MTHLAPMTTMPPIVTVVAAQHADAELVPMTSIPHPMPNVLDADNLRDAARQRARLPADALVLLRVDVSPDARGTGSAIAFAADARRLAGLIADAVRVRLAAGAVVVGADPDLLSGVRAALTESGFRTTAALSGWRFDDAWLRRIG